MLALNFFKNFILFLNFTILYWFCQISKRIHHRYTCVPHPEPSTLLPPHTIPLGRPSAPAPSIQYSASNWTGDTFHICIGEGNGNSLQCSCLENPREPGGLPSMGSHRVGYDWRDLAAAVDKWCLTLCDPINCSTPISFVLHYLLEFA